MAIDPAALLALPIPPVRQRVTQRDAVLHALSVGLGADPVDPRQLDCVGAHRALRASSSRPVR